MTDTPTPPNWAEVPRATVRWSLVRVDGDATDVAVGDRVTLYPTVTGIAVVDPLDANPVSVLLEPRTYKVRGDGALVDDQGDMAAVLAVDDPRVATPGGRVVQWIARHERRGEVVRFPAAAGATVELSRWVAAMAPEPTQRAWAERLVDAAEDVTAGLAAAVGAGDAAVTAAGQAFGSATAAAGSADAAAAAAAAADADRIAAEAAASSAAGSASSASSSASAADAARAAAEQARDDTNALDLDVTATTLAPGAAATATVSGVLPNLTLALGIPEGEQGDTGPANTLRIGTVTTLPAGSAATASIGGTAPSQTLSLGLPTGAPSDWLKVGPGDPRTPSTTGGQITGTEPNGCTYISTDGGGVGGYGWRKRGGVWVCVEGDTGVRVVSLDAAWRNAFADGVNQTWSGTSSLTVRRIGDVVTVLALGLQKAAAPAANAIAAIPAGWRPQIAQQFMGFNSSLQVFRLWSNGDGDYPLSLQGPISNGSFSFTLSYHTRSPWPTALPGTAA